VGITDIDSSVLNSLVRQGYSQQSAISIIEKYKGYYWLHDFLRFIFMILGTLFTTLSISIGCLFFEKQINFHVIFRAVMFAQIVWFIQPFVQILWYIFVKPEYNSDDIESFATFSLADFFSTSSSNTSYFSGVLTLFSIASVGYCLVISFGTGVLLEEPIRTHLPIIILSYFCASLIGNLFIIFISITYSN
jgi:hypothetical protein